MWQFVRNHPTLAAVIIIGLSLWIHFFLTVQRDLENEYQRNTFKHHESSAQREMECTNPTELTVSVQSATEIAKTRRVNVQSATTEWSIVTGGGGFIGSHVAEHCLSLGQNVVVVDDLSGGFAANIPSDSRYPGRVVFEDGSIGNDTFIERVFQRYGTGENSVAFVYHLAAYAAVGLSHFIRHYNYDTNFMGSIKLINLAVNHNVECFVFTSSISVYGSGPYPGFSGKFTERTAALPEDPYGISKYAVELDLKAAHELFGLNYIIFRPHNVYGPRQNIFDKYRNVVGIFLYNLLHNEPMGIFGDGRQTRSFSYIDDVAPYIAAAPYFEHLQNKLFNIGADAVHSLSDLARAVAESMVFDSDLLHRFHQHSPRNIMTEVERKWGGGARSSNIDRERVLDDLMASEVVLKYLEARSEVLNVEASHKYFQCMFGIDEANIVPLSDGLNLTLNWILSMNYDPKSWRETTLFHPVSFESVEIARNIPTSWIEGAEIKISSKAKLSSDQ